eukprot:CAMPEP_0176379686 /NCGR_PEP_ID=MMETSP0126-20121128/30545_1 /TAXON_ID=141414 ORGANISM="Strombidinopsis acuminatum, Strain SPMC142" /NCGR_SAMPLE_ID=MMETSP0126 /ASSEMBLY_ACC=CAM_ASM_000229 /LENGTH=137 /DNA_ID=CAMNT_0017742589 /DNA_START=687 /DNA_END=1103 /DNA_ORIENTATION=-
MYGQQPMFNSSHMNSKSNPASSSDDFVFTSKNMPARISSTKYRSLAEVQEHIIQQNSSGAKNGSVYEASLNQSPSVALAPESSYLYKGSQARKTVAELLDVKESNNNLTSSGSGQVQHANVKLNANGTVIIKDTRSS